MANCRTYTDEQLAEAVRNAMCWSDVMEGLGKARGQGYSSLKTHVARLALDTSHFVNPSSDEPLPNPGMPFTRPPKSGPRLGLSIAARWFLERGYNVSVPLESAAYDLVAESDEGLKRVQVKTAHGKSVNGRQLVQLTRSIYDPTSPSSTRGSYRRVAYSPDVIDLFFVVTGAGRMYLFPVEATNGTRFIVLDRKYSAFEVFAAGVTPP